MDVSEPVHHNSYPKCVIFILLFEFCERFCFHEIFSIITIYLTSYLQLSENFTVTYYHALLTLTYLFPVFGAVLTYSFLGKFKLVVYASCVYIFAVLLLLLSTIVPLNLPQIPLSLTSLALITITAGTLKPCIPLIGGDQFVLPEQEDQLSSYFSSFNLVIVLSALAGKTVAPFLRERVHCFGENNCFVIIFGISLILITTGAVVFCLGRRYYRIVACENNIVTVVVNWILETRKIERNTNTIDKSSIPTKPINEIKICLRIWFTILPFIVLSGASDIRYTLMFFQAMRMDGDIGFYEILPDQFSVIEAIITLPIFAFVSNVVFPICRRHGFMKKALQKVILGGSLVGLSLVGAGMISVIMEKNYPELPVAGQGQINIYNTLPCDIVINSDELDLENAVILSGGVLNRIARVRNCKDFPYVISSECFNSSGLIKVCEKDNFSYFFKDYSIVSVKDANTEKDTKGVARFRSFTNLNKTSSSGINLKRNNGSGEFLSSSKFKTIPLGSYASTLDNFTHSFNITEKDYTLMVIARNASHFKFSMSEKLKPNRLAMLWMMPHRLLNCLGEMIATSAVLEFCYSEAPANIKNIAVAGYYLMISAGNIVIITMQAICPFQELSSKFFLYSGLLLIDLLVLAIMAKGYRRTEET